MAERHGLAIGSVERLTALLGALEAEPHPPTTICDPARAVDEHLADSLSGLRVAGLRRAGRIADLGAGAGFPGLALALALPAASVDLVEATTRKGEVMERLAAAAGIHNTRVLSLRAEELAAFEGREAYDVVTARALGPLVVLAEYASPLLREGGVLVAWKGARDPAEESAVTRSRARTAMETVEVLDAHPYPAARSRHLHVLAKAGPTPRGLPRRPGMARKRPLA